MIVTSETGITLVGGAPISPDILGRCLERAPYLVAVDGGAAQALALGHRALATIGDLDSLQEAVRARLPENSVHSIAEQDTTDFAKALRNVSAPFLLATGVTGGRLDHTLAALSTLTAHMGPPCIVVGQEDVIVSVPRDITLTLPLGTRVSLYPLTPLTAHSEGLQWPLEGLTLGPLQQLGTSNRSTAPQVRLRFAAPGALVLLPLEALDAVLMGLGISARSPGSGGL
jgi:thiamine pyrophosphokinase